jgi:hypothetical protein
MRRATTHDKRDKNQKSIVDALEAHGFMVHQLGYPVDLLIVDRRTRWAMWCEVKMGTTSDKYYANQLHTAAFCPLPFAFVTTPAEAVEYVRSNRPAAHGRMIRDWRYIGQ